MHNIVASRAWSVIQQNFTSAEGDSRRYSQNLSRCCTNTVSTNHLRILLLYSRYGCSASNQSLAGPLEGKFLQVMQTISCTNACVPMSSSVLVIVGRRWTLVPEAMRVRVQLTWVSSWCESHSGREPWWPAGYTACPSPQVQSEKKAENKYLCFFI